MNLEKQIQIKCGAEEYNMISELNEFQGNLKSITEQDFKKLKQSLIKSGLPLGFHIWIDQKGKKWLLDGHHRFKAFKALEGEGYFIPALPCNVVKAETKKEAAQIVLISNSHYAKMTQESLSDYMIDFELNMIDLDFLDVPIPNFNFDNQLESEEPKNNSGELDLGEFSEFDHKCPKCGFEFNKKENE